MTQRIVPFIGYEDAAGAIEWLERAFGFEEDRSARYEEDGTITHAELNLLHGPEEPGYGYRVYTAEDPEGHRWMFGQRLEASA
jgi:uncharacterized glyoxalase superfamily protein PhnB